MACRGSRGPQLLLVAPEADAAAPATPPDGAVASEVAFRFLPLTLPRGTLVGDLAAS